MSEGLVTLANTEISTDEFSFTPSVSYDVKDILSVRGSFFFSPDISSDMVSSVEELKGLQDGTGRVTIPLKEYTGPARSCITYPDIIEIGKKVARVKGKEELRNVIFKALDLDGTTSNGATDGNDQQSSSPSAGQSPTNPEPEKEIINNILNAIFK